jgi:hypothetical protein
MFERDEVHKAVELHRRSYNLLRWLSTAISKGFIQFERAHDYADQATAAKEWIQGHYLNLPASCRPPLDQLDAFAQFFATYLTTSFDLVEKAGTRVTSGCGCYCPICTYVTSAPHLTVKKVTRQDKARARKLKLESVEQLGKERGISLDEKRIEKLVDAPESSENVSLMTYGQQLIARTHGRSKGPAVLVLWREIAWDKKGAPKKGFELDADSIVNAEIALTQLIADADSK